jgi:hypothetical protein
MPPTILDYRALHGLFVIGDVHTYVSCKKEGGATNSWMVRRRLRIVRTRPQPGSFVLPHDIWIAHQVVACIKIIKVESPVGCGPPLRLVAEENPQPAEYLTVSLCRVASPASGDAPNRQTCDCVIGVQVGFEYELDHPDLVQIDSIVLDLTGRTLRAESPLLPNNFSKRSTV